MAEKGFDVEASIARMIEGDPDDGRPGIQDSEHREDVKAYLRVRRQVDGVSPLTRRNDVSALLKLADFLHRERGGKAFGDATPQDLMDWVDALDDHYDLAESTIGVYQAHVKRFYKWIHDPDTYRRGKRARREMPYPEAVEWMDANGDNGKRSLPVDALLQEQDVARMVEVCTSPRDKALVMTLWDAGLRVQELINLDVRNFQTDRHGGYLLLNADGAQQKTGQRRVRLVEAVPYLVSHLNAHPVADRADAPLFYTENSEDYAAVVRGVRAEGNSNGSDQGADRVPADIERLRLSRGGVAGIVKRIAEHAGLDQNVTPHLFRHSRATFLAGRGVNEAVLRARFGWSPTSDTPAKYMHLSGAQEDAAILQACGREIEAEAEDDEEPFAPATCVYGHDNEPTARFCVECGVPMDGEEDEQALRLGQELKEVLEDSEAARELAERLAEVWVEREGQEHRRHTSDGRPRD